MYVGHKEYNNNHLPTACCLLRAVNLPLVQAKFKYPVRFIPAIIEFHLNQKAKPLFGVIVVICIEEEVKY